MERMPGLKIGAIPLVNPDEARVILYEDVKWSAKDAPPVSSEAIGTRFYPGSLRLPTAGKWRLLAVSAASPARMSAALMEAPSPRHSR
jgi:hypothetical protein